MIECPLWRNASSSSSIHSTLSLDITHVYLPYRYTLHIPADLGGSPGRTLLWTLPPMRDVGGYANLHMKKNSLPKLRELHGFWYGTLLSSWRRNAHVIRLVVFIMHAAMTTLMLLHIVNCVQSRFSISYLLADLALLMTMGNYLMWHALQSLSTLKCSRNQGDVLMSDSS